MSFSFFGRKKSSSQSLKLSSNKLSFENVTEETVQDDKPVLRQPALPKTLQEIFEHSDASMLFSLYMKSMGASPLVQCLEDVKEFKSNSNTIAKCFSDAVRRRRNESTHVDSDRRSTIRYSGSSEGDVSDYGSIDYNGDFDLNENLKSLNIDREACAASPSVESFDSGITFNQPCLKNDQQLSSAEQLVLNQTREAICIYKKYLSMDSSCLNLEISSELVQTVLDQICSNSGFVVDPGTFDEVTKIIEREIEEIYIDSFLRSTHYAKLMFDVLSHRQDCIIDISEILDNEVLLFLFMEFIDSKSHRNLLEFWICAKNYRRKLVGDSKFGELEHLKSDAIMIFEKFLTSESKSPLGVDENLRKQVENKIFGKTDRIDETCFDQIVQHVTAIFQRHFLKLFLESDVLSSYLKELKTLIEASQVSFHLNELSIEIERVRTPSRSSFQLPSLIHPDEPDFLQLDNNANECRLWKRKNLKMSNIGSVDVYGRYATHYELPPDSFEDTIFTSPRTSGTGSRLSRVFRKFITGPDLEKEREDVSWQVALMIVGQVLAKTNANFYKLV